MGLDLWEIKYKKVGRFSSEIYDYLFDLFYNVDTGMICIKYKDKAIKEICKMNIDKEEKKELLQAVRKMKELEDYKIF